VDDNKWLYWKPEIFSDIFARRIFKLCHPKKRLSRFLRTISIISIISSHLSRANIHALGERNIKDPYKVPVGGKPYVVLAIAHRLRVMSNLVLKTKIKRPGYT